MGSQPPQPRSLPTGRELAEAAEANKHDEALRILKDQNPDVNQKSSSGRTPLINAVRFGWADVTALLLQAKVPREWEGTL